MRVCMVSTSFSSSGLSAGEWIVQHARGIAERGVSVDVVAPDYGDEAEREPLPGVTVHRFSYWWPPSAQRVAGGHGILENLRESWAANLQLPAFLAAFIAKTTAVARRCDIVHINWAPAMLAGLPAKRLWKKPVVLTVHGSGGPAGLKKFPPWLLRPAVGAADAVISPHPHLTAILTSLGRTEGVHEIKYLIDFNRFTSGDGARVREALGLGGAPVVTFVGRLLPFRDPETFVRAAAILLGRRAAVHCLVVGSGPLEGRVRALISPGIERSVHLLGHRTDVEDVLAASDVFVASSPIENCFANSVLEAMIAGVPSVLSSAGDTPECFPDGWAARLFPPRDAEALAAAIEDVLDDADLRARLVGNAMAALREFGFDRDLILDRTLGLYQRLLRN